MRRVMEITTPLKKDVLLFHRMTAREELGRLSEFQIDLLSTRGDIDLDEILAKNVTVTLELPEAKTRYFNGYVTRFAQVGVHGRHHLYHATVRPWLWFLTRTSDCRIFQNMTVPDIIQQVFDDHKNIVNVKKELNGTYREYEYCVQYRETDFNFVSRLMEQEGIYYYFKHEDGQHALVLADSDIAHSSFEGYAKIPFIAQETATDVELDGISEWDFAREIQPGSVMIDDYDAKNASAELQVQAKTKNERGHDLANYEIFDYPGEYVKKPEGEEYVRIRIEELQVQHELARGETTARGVCSGHLFKLTDHIRSDQNREYLVVSTVQNLEYSDYESMDNTGVNYRCNFTVLNSREPYRSQRSTPEPMVQGPQTAVVVGPSGDEIHTDEFGRVKVQFHWDRYGKLDENSSCWIRVSQAHAGKGFGGIDIPRIGEEVIVEFLEGDPDRPIITGRVYNSDNKPPTELPKGGMVSGLKSNSTPGGGGNNSILLDDTKEKEKLSIHAQHNMDSTVENDLSLTVVSGNETRTVSAGTQTVTIEGDTSLTVKAGDRVVNVTGSYKCDATNEINLQAPSKITLICGGSTITMEPGKIVLTAGGGATLTLDGNATIASSGGSQVLLDGSATMSSPGECTVEAPKSTLSGSGSTTVADAGGVAVTGPKVSLNG